MAVLTLPENADPYFDWKKSREASRAAIREYHEIQSILSRRDPALLADGREIKRLAGRLPELTAQYFASLPTVVFSRCPLCNQPLTGAFDPWGFDGFWWIPDRRDESVRVTGCEHYRLLLGAVSLLNHPPISGPYVAKLGPDTPYLIPRLLDLKTMVAVIHALPMIPGYVAYPIAYFSSEEPPCGFLTAAWTDDSYSYTLPDGSPAWTMRDDPWIFDFSPWQARQQVRWTIPNNASALLAPLTGSCPYINHNTVQRPQECVDNRVYHNALPSNETSSPFE